MTKRLTALASSVVLLVLAGCGGEDAEPAAAPAAPELSPRAGAPIDVGGTPIGIAADDTGVWVADNSGALLRLDPEHPESKPDRIKITGGPLAVAIGEDAIWVAGGDGTITRVDPESEQATRLQLHVTQPGGIAAGAGSIWVTSSAANQLVRIDPGSGNTIGEPINVGELPTDVVVGAGSVWVANTNDGTVSRIDAASGVADDPIEVAQGQVSALALGEGGIWFAKSDDKFGDMTEVGRIDPATDTAGPASAPVDAGIPVRVAAGEGSIWTTLVGDSRSPDGSSEPSVAVIDPATGEAATMPVPVGERPSGIATGAGAVWVADAGDGTVTRIDPGP